MSKASSPYMLFCHDKRIEIKNNNPKASFGEIGVILGKEWGKLPAEEKEAYIQKAKELKFPTASDEILIKIKELDKQINKLNNEKLKLIMAMEY